MDGTRTDNCKGEHCEGRGKEGLVMGGRRAVDKGKVKREKRETKW